MDINKINQGVKNCVETLVYVLSCVASLGVVWLLKIIIKKAVIEANDY